jgi:hypothetical protein
LMGKVCRATVSKLSPLCSDHGRIGPAVELTIQASLLQLQLGACEWAFRTKASLSHSLAIFEGRLAQRLRFHNFSLQF